MLVKTVVFFSWDGWFAQAFRLTGAGYTWITVVRRYLMPYLSAVAASTRLEALVFLHLRGSTAFQCGIISTLLGLGFNFCMLFRIKQIDFQKG